MPSTAKVHVISKVNNTVHTTVTTDTTHFPPLAANSVRVRTSLVSLTANNLTYARFGDLYGWWQAFPVPSNLPLPYNDATKYGIVPVWGYGEILESKLDALKLGTLMYGYWPASNVPVDLELEPMEPEGHWYDRTEHRRALWSIYHRYQAQEPSLRLDRLSQMELEEQAWLTIFRPVWECGFAIDRFLFGEVPVHPLGKNGGDWTAKDADLRRAVVVSLSASGKTARAFNDACLNNDRHVLGFLAITSRVDGTLLPTKTSIPTKTVSYDQATSSDTMAFITSKRPDKIVIVDFGGRGDSLTSLILAVRNHSAAKLVIIGCGGDARVKTSEEDLGRYLETLRLPERIQMNTSAVRDQAIEKVGAEKYWSIIDEGWNGFVGRGNMRGLKLELRDGVDAFEGGWRRLCEGGAADIDGMAFRLDK